MMNLLPEQNINALLWGMAKAIKLMVKVYDYTKFFISLFEKAFKIMKNGIYFIVIALLVAEFCKILIYANQMACDITLLI